MKTKHFLLVTCLSLGATTTIGQVINPVQPDVNLAPVGPANTGLAIAPAVDVHAAAFEHGCGSYRIYWLDGPSGTILDADNNPGFDPDVAYYANADALVVAYENGGAIMVDDYYLSTLSPLNYVRFGTTGVAGGTYPNVDMNSSGNGILCWENGGDVYACSFNIGTFTPGPVTMIANNVTQPDIILLDDNNTAAVTYVDQGSGDLRVEIFDYWALTTGAYVPWMTWNTPPMTFYEYPRIASQRNSMFSSVKDFAVVAQDFNGGEYEVHGFFFLGATSLTGPVVLNAPPLIGGGCAWQQPKPVVAFDRNKIDVAWGQEYSCSGLSSGSGLDDDIVLGEFDIFGNNINGPTFYYEVNQVQSAYAGISGTSISTEYDGNYMITPSNYNEGILFSDPSTLRWKRRNAPMPNFISEPGDGTLLSEVQTFSVENNPVKETIQVVSVSDAEATFELYDNAGRRLEIKQLSNGNNTYSIDISHLSGGTYFLKCTSAADEEVLRVLQVR